MNAHPSARLPRPLVITLGVLLVAAGVAVPLYVMSPDVDTSGPEARLYSDGPLRPSMIVLPNTLTNGRAIAIAETEVSQSQFFRVMQHRTYRLREHREANRGNQWRRAFSLQGQPGSCPAPAIFEFEAPVTCISGNLARAYAIELTIIENNLRRRSDKPLLTQCYQLVGTGFSRYNENCTGYRLPTEEEIRFTLTIGGRGGLNYAAIVGKELGCEAVNSEECVALLRIHPVKSRNPNDWHIFHLLGNADELLESGGKISTIFPQATPGRTLDYSNRRTTSFRIVRNSAPSPNN